MGVIEAIGTVLICILFVAFLLTGTLFFMEGTILLNKLSEVFGSIGAIAIPLKGGAPKKPVSGSNTDPV